jgi:hypothetical protein
MLLHFVGRPSTILLLVLCCLCWSGGLLRADAPVASYIFPAGGQRGATVAVRVGGLFLHKSCGFELVGPGITASRQLQRTHTVFFEGPLLPLPDSQQAEDYPKDMAGTVCIAADASPGLRHGRLWTSEGAASGLRFMVGELPEVVEQEIDGDPVPVEVTLPVTINGRIYPREDVDDWSFQARKGQIVSCEACTARLGSPLDARLTVFGHDGRRLAENEDCLGADPFVSFTAPNDGTYRVRIHDVNMKGGPDYVYRLTLTSDPRLERIYPLGGRRGTTTAFSLSGKGLPLAPIPVRLPAEAPREFPFRYAAGGTATNSMLLDLDDLPEYLEAEPNDEPQQAQTLVLPAVANGRIDRPGDADLWAFAAKKGDPVILELRAARLGSPLVGKLTVLDSTGKELAKAEALAAHTDPALTFTPPADGIYFVRVADCFRTRGGPAFAYRLRLTPPTAPGFHLGIESDALTLLRGKTVKLKLTAERVGGFNAAIPLSLDGLPAGVLTKNAVIPAGQSAVDVLLEVAPSAAVAVSRVMVRGEAKIGGTVHRETATLPVPREDAPVDSVLLAIALPAPFKIVGVYDLRLAARGTLHHRRYKVERNGYDGPIEVSVADRQTRHLQGADGPQIVVPASCSEFEFVIRLPPWMQTGRTCRVCVMGEAAVTDGGEKHVVSYTSAAQNEQIVAVVETGRLGLEVERTSVAAVSGGSVTVQVKVSRGEGLTGPVRLELTLPAHVRGVSADPVSIPADRSRGTLTLHFAKGAASPFNGPVVLRATLSDASGPVTAETRLEIVPEDG